MWCLAALLVLQAVNVVVTLLKMPQTLSCNSLGTDDVRYLIGIEKVFVLLLLLLLLYYPFC
jgi:hypothetical protein